MMNLNEDNGEIPFLDADPLDASLPKEDMHFVEDNDAKALQRIEARLRSNGRTEAQIEEIAVDLYNCICEQIRSGRASSEQLVKAAQLFGEEPQSLRDRL